VRKLLSVLTNKTILPHKPLQLAKPYIFLQHYKPATKIIQQQHKTINTILDKKLIKIFTNDLTHQLYRNLTPKTDKIRFRFNIPITQVAKEITHKTLRIIFQAAKNLLPEAAKGRIDATFTNKNMPSLPHCSVTTKTHPPNQKTPRLHLLRANATILNFQHTITTTDI